MDSNNSLFMVLSIFLIFLLVFNFGLMRVMSSYGIGNNQQFWHSLQFPPTVLHVITALSSL